MTVCRVCHRPLRSPESIALGAGPVCVPRLAASRPSCHPTLPGMPRPLATIDQDAPAVAGTAACTSSPVARRQEADPRQASLPWASVEGPTVEAVVNEHARARLVLRGIEVEVEDTAEQTPKAALELLFMAWRTASQPP